MADLKACFEAMGFTEVKTYIQSGNVLFTSEQKDKPSLEKKVEIALSKQFSYTSTVVLLTSQQLQKAVDDAPKGFGKDASSFRYDVLFLKDSLSAKDAMQQIKLKEGVDNVFVGPSVLYFERLVSRLTQSYVSKIVQLPIYKQMTIRNWNTTTKLLTFV